MALIKFERLTAPTGTVNFTKNPLYGLGKPYRFRQPRDLSDGGDQYVYDKGVTEEIFELSWKTMKEEDWTVLDSFIRNVAEGAKNTFTYYDEDGNTHTVRLESEVVDFREIRNQLYKGTLKLRKVA
jgi:hypothetical protein